MPRIIGPMVGTTLPKPDLEINDPRHGAYVRGKKVITEKVTAALHEAKENGDFADLYILKEGETLDDVPESATAVIDPNGGPDEPENPSGGIDISGATVGQTVKIAAVDDKGVPTAWEPVDFPGGGGGGTEWTTAFSKRLTEAVAEIQLELPKDYTELYIHVMPNFSNKPLVDADGVGVDGKIRAKIITATKNMVLIHDTAITTYSGAWGWLYSRPYRNDSGVPIASKPTPWIALFGQRGSAVSNNVQSSSPQFGVDHVIGDLVIQAVGGYSLNAGLGVTVMYK